MTKIKAGSVVFHQPTEEEWLVLGVSLDEKRLCAAGWPPTIAYTSDCVFVEQKELKEDEIEYRQNTFGSGWE